MTGPAPSLPARAAPGPLAGSGFASGRPRVSPRTGRFTDPALEQEFCAHLWPDWARTTRVVALLAATMALSFGYIDYLALGLGPKLYAAWSMRLAVLASALWVAHVSRRPERSLDHAAFLMMLTLATAVTVLVILEHKGMLRESLSAILCVLGFYLFVPTRFPMQCAGALVLTAGFLVAQGFWGVYTTAEYATVLIEMVICNVLGAFSALRLHGLQRREYLGFREARERARLEELVALQSSRFITLPYERIDEGVMAALAELGTFVGADRCYVFEFSDDQKEMSCTYEWCAPGVASGPKAVQKAPVDTFGWGFARALNRLPILAARLEDLPEEAHREREACRLWGVQSLAALPLVSGERVIGGVGFHAVHQPREWSEELLSLLRMIGEMIVNVILRHRSELALEQQRRALETSVGALQRSNEELQQFVYVASHDLQEPLRSISSFSKLLSDRYRDQLDWKADEYIDFLTSAAARMHALITDLLSYSRLDSGARPFTCFESATVAQEALANLKASIDEVGARVELGPLPRVEGDRGQVLQLFQNLVGNAIKFNDSVPPRVWVKARRQGPLWEFSVADNGIGIAPEHVPRLFKVFTRLHDAGRYPGTGIGLAVCKRIVERHRGSISAEPRAPHGTLFRFTLPATPEA